MTREEARDIRHRAPALFREGRIVEALNILVEVTKAERELIDQGIAPLAPPPIPPLEPRTGVHDYLVHIRPDKTEREYRKPMPKQTELF